MRPLSSLEGSEVWAPFWEVVYNGVTGPQPEWFVLPWRYTEPAPSSARSMVTDPLSTTYLQGAHMFHAHSASQRECIRSCVILIKRLLDIVAEGVLLTYPESTIAAPWSTTADASRSVCLPQT